MWHDQQDLDESASIYIGSKFRAWQHAIHRSFRATKRPLLNVFRQHLSHAEHTIQLPDALASHSIKVCQESHVAQ
jgi:hypothetical protein